MELTDQDKECILDALRTQYIQVRAGSITAEEAHGTQQDIKELYLKLGGTLERWPEPY